MIKLTFLVENILIDEKENQKLSDLFDTLGQDWINIFKIYAITRITDSWVQSKNIVEKPNAWNLNEDKTNIFVEWDFSEDIFENMTSFETAYANYNIVYENVSIYFDSLSYKIIKSDDNITMTQMTEEDISINIYDGEANAYLQNIINKSILIEQELKDQHSIIEVNDERRIGYHSLGTTPNLNILINKDNDAEIITFKLKRYYDGVDLSQKNIYIYFIRPDKKSFQEPLQIIFESIEEDCFNVVWTVKDLVTSVPGILTYALVAKGKYYTDEYFWQTYPATFEISKGIFDYIESESEFLAISMDEFQKQLENDVNILKNAYSSGIIKWQKLSSLFEGSDLT